MKILFRTALLVVLAGFGAACASAGGSSDTNAPRVMVNVDNSARADLDVSVVRDGQTLRLGRVQVGDQRRFRVPEAFLRSSPYSFGVEVVARDGTGRYTTPQLVVHQGQNVYIDASPTLQSSRFEVR